MGEATWQGLCSPKDAKRAGRAQLKLQGPILSLRPQLSKGQVTGWTLWSVLTRKCERLRNL